MTIEQKSKLRIVTWAYMFGIVISALLKQNQTINNTTFWISFAGLFFAYQIVLCILFGAKFWKRNVDRS